MDREIDASGGEGFFYLFGENSFAQTAFGTDLGEGDVGDFVAGGVDDFDFDIVSACVKKRRDVVRLPQSELGAAGADAEFRHGRPEAVNPTKAKGGRLGRLGKVVL